VLKKSSAKFFFFGLMKLFTNSKNHFDKSLQRP
jgi:hypothetical protein